MFRLRRPAIPGCRPEEELAMRPPPKPHRLIALLAALTGALLAACGAPVAAPSPALPTAAAPAAEPPAATERLRLATTTSTADSGLLDAILPVFEAQHNARVEVIAVGTGQALELGANGDVDVVLVHARSREDVFVAEGYGVNRRDVMYNDFIIVGPPDDPAGIVNAVDARQAFTAIATVESPFASRGDESGTHSKELGIWASAAITPTAEMAWYRSLGQGMGETLLAANELGAYTLADRGTWLAQQGSLPELRILFGGATINENPDPALYNPYGVIPVNPERHEGLNGELAEQFAAWLSGPEAAALIGAYGVEEFGQPLFFPGTAAP
jgi:tungstate transport system substrate-binding protein